MKLLLDTHVLVWWLEDNPRLISPVFAAAPAGQPLSESIAGRRRRLLQADEKEMEEDEPEVVETAPSPAAGQMLKEED